MTTQRAQSLTQVTFGELLRRWRRSQRLAQIVALTGIPADLALGLLYGEETR